jgi:DNA repair protein RAD16
MATLKHHVLDKTLLRRTKVQCADVLALPPRTIIIRRDKFDDRELDYYEALYTQSKVQFGGYVDAGTVLNNYAHVFDLLMRLRQAVNHPYLVIYSATAASQDCGRSSIEQGQTSTRQETFPLQQVEASACIPLCELCKDPAEDVVSAACGHSFCRFCVVDYMESGGSSSMVGNRVCCPTCTAPLTVNFSKAKKPLPSSRLGAQASKKRLLFGGGTAGGILSRIDPLRFQSSTKIEALREELELMLQEDSSAKAIVFSQFTAMLDLCAFRLTQVGIKCARLSGSMSLEARDRAIKSFTEDPDVTVFLMSLKAGGVALNLTAASHCFVMDSWWNPATEWQAMDRIHRLGQHRPMKCVKFVIAGTIEERIVKLQEKKMAVFEATVGQDADALGKLTEDDMKFLFN